MYTMGKKLVVISFTLFFCFSQVLAQSDPELIKLMEQNGLYDRKLFEFKTPSNTKERECKSEKECAFVDAQMLAREQITALENTDPEQIREGLLKQVDLLIDMAHKLRDQANGHQELADQAQKLEEQAETLRMAADDSQIKEKLLATTKALVPKNDFTAWDSDWEKFRKSEYYATGGMILGAVASETLIRQDKIRWEGGIGPDDAIRKAIMLNDPDSRSKVDTATTVGVNALTAWATLEPLIIAWREGNKTMAVQSTLIDVESYAAMAFLTGLTKSLTARQRPSGDNNQSFWSGHTAHAFTAAGLVCTHHSYMSLYGNKTADNSACWAAMTVASLVGVGRIVADKHHATDVAVGAVVGIFSGMILPRILHYGAKKFKINNLDSTIATQKVKKEKRKLIQFKFEIGTIGEERVSPGIFIKGIFW